MTKPDITADPRWARIVARDETADGEFWYSVASTGVYCRPSCPSRQARPENVTIHATMEQARASGARPCRRCNPEGSSREAQDAALIEQACRVLEGSGAPPTLVRLAEQVELSPAHFHRLFKSMTGVTPKGYADAVRARRMRAELPTAGTVTAAIHAAGYGSSARFYETSTDRLGMTPARYRAGGAEETLRFAIGQCALGSVLVAMSDRGVAAILIGDDADVLLRDLQDRFPRAELVGGDAAFERHIAVVVGLIDAPRGSLGLPLDIRGTAFQQRVWQALRNIPPGRTASYAEVARAIGAPASVRAVAAACGANPLAVAIPCHRVVRSDGGLSGYRWGIERKRALLDKEAEA